MKALVAAAVTIAASLGIAPSASAAKAVSLRDAEVAPTYLVYLYPHGSVSYGYGRNGYTCPRGGYFSDVSAYSWRGGKLRPQRWDRIGVYYWGIPGRHGRVTFDGVRFLNESPVPVLVAGWCE